jgi:hypothetical protein
MKRTSYLGALAGVLLFAGSVSAQDEAADGSRYVPRVHISGGYSVVRPLQADQSIPGGWFITADKNINNSLGLTLDASASGTLTRRRDYIPGYVTHWSTGGLLIGPTFFNRVNDGYGAAVAIQPGVGVDVNVNRHIGFRATADYRPLFGVGTAGGERASQIWLRTGIVVSFGTAPAARPTN